MQPSIAHFPFYEVCIDLFHTPKAEWLALVDAFSGYLWPVLLKETSTDAIISALSPIFQRFGNPCRLRSDNAPNLDSAKFKKWCESLDIEKCPSSVYRPSSNGRAENAVRLLKHLALKSDNMTDFNSAVRIYNNTPLSDLNVSPNELVFGRLVRSELPMIPEAAKLLSPDDYADAARKRSELQHRTKVSFDSRSKTLPSVSINDWVRIQDPKSKKWDQIGKIIHLDRANQARLELPDGSIITRSRAHYKPSDDSAIRFQRDLFSKLPKKNQPEKFYAKPPPIGGPDFFDDSDISDADLLQAANAVEHSLPHQRGRGRRGCGRGHGQARQRSPVHTRSRTRQLGQSGIHHRSHYAFSPPVDDAAIDALADRAQRSLRLDGAGYGGAKRKARSGPGKARY